jgi:hypothetical protein
VPDFVTMPFRFGVGAAHREFAGRNVNERHSDSIRKKLFARNGLFLAARYRP